jgi:hypothetical protein
MTSRLSKFLIFPFHLFPFHSNSSQFNIQDLYLYKLSNLLFILPFVEYFASNTIYSKLLFFLSSTNISGIDLEDKVLKNGILLLLELLFIFVNLSGIVLILC